MDETKKKTALRMIPYGLYVLTAAGQEGKISAATINWVTQASFHPPLLVACVRGDSSIHAAIQHSGAFALHILAKDQQATAFTFFKPVAPEGQTIGGMAFSPGQTGSPVLHGVPAFLECRLSAAVGKGDHTVFVGEVVAANAPDHIEGRSDEATLWLKDLGKNIYYGG